MAGLVEQIRTQALQRPDHDAVRRGESVISFRVLEGASNLLARQLLEQGCTGSIAHFGQSGPSHAISLLAAQKAGLAFTALDDDAPFAVLRGRIEAAGVAIITAGAIETETAKSLGPTVVEVSKDGLADPIARDIKPDAISHIRFTSGSTGRTRAVCLTHGHTERMTKVIGRFLPADPGDQYALLGQFWPMVMLRALSVGATVHCINFSRIGLSETRTRLRQARITALFAYPQAIRTIIGDNAQFPDIRYLHVSGDVLSARDLHQYQRSLATGTKVHASFGSTEFPWIAAYLHEVRKTDAHNSLPIGTPVFPGEVQILRGDGTKCATGETGQIVVQSPDLPKGYLNDPENTRKHFDLGTNARTFRTGDMAYADESGLWHGRGRIDDMIKVRGANVWPGEVERVLETHPAVREAAVTKARSATGEVCLSAFFVADDKVEATELRRFLRARLPGPMVPSAFTKVTELPKTDTGKLVRSKLPQTTITPSLQASHDSPEGKTERMIAQVWEKMLGTTQLDRNADFLDLGGDSLMAVEMLVRVEKVLGRRIPIDVLSLEGGSIAALARWLNGAPPGNAPVQMRGGNSQKMVMFPVAGGHLSDYLRLIEIFRGPHEILGLRPSGLSPDEAPETNMADLAAAMARSLHPSDTPPILLGYSFGALTAYEAACQLTTMGQPVDRLVMIDPPMDWQSDFPMLRFLFRCLRARDFSRFFNGLRHATHAVPDNRRLDAAHLKAALGFKPKPLSGVRTLMITGDDDSRTSGHEVWAELLGEALEVRHIPASHVNLMRPPAVVRTAEEIADWLDRSEGKCDDG